jgi:hypothetical protein
MTWNFDKNGKEISALLEKELQEAQQEREKFAEKMRSLVGKCVKDVLGDELHGFVIVFDDETMITATDSEFGDNAFEFVDKTYLGVVV